MATMPKTDVCPWCDGSGLVCPDAFGEYEPWHTYCDRMAEKALAEGWPLESDPIEAGMLRPLPCPNCLPTEHLAERTARCR